MKHDEKNCVVCGKLFEPYTSARICCSPECSQIHAKERRHRYALEQNQKMSTVGKPTTCKICGKEFIKQYSVNYYCSEECKRLGAEVNNEKYKKMNPTYSTDRSRKIRGNQEYTKTCVVCGKVFTTWRSRKNTCSDECYRKRDNSKRGGRSRKTPEQEHKNYIIRTYGSEEAHMAYLEELEQKKQAQMEQARIRREQEREERRRARQKQIEEAKRKREERKEANHRIGKCVVCGNEFDTYNPAQKTCSKECGKKLAHAHKHKRIPKSQLVDKDITLEALYRRDSGVCRLCGKKCDWNDKTNESVGPTYPSIDHIIPVSRGGLHAWNNVQLAHFECNWKKSDTLIEV